MLERFSEAEQAAAKKTSIEERLKDYPELRAKFERMLGIIENAAGDVEKAAEAERRVAEELRQMVMKCCTNGRGASSRGRKSNSAASRV